MIKYALRKCDRAAILALETHIEGLKSWHDDIERTSKIPENATGLTPIQCYSMGQMKTLEEEVKALSHFLKAYMKMFKGDE